MASVRHQTKDGCLLVDRDRSTALPVHYWGGFNSLTSQPTASIFMGSTGKESFSTRWQVQHSNVRSSKPRFPGEIRAKPNLCLQVGHIGRTIVESKLLTPAPHRLKVTGVCDVMSSKISWESENKGF